MSSGSGGPRDGQGERPIGQGPRRGGGSASGGRTGGGPPRPPRAPQGGGRGTNRQEAARRRAAQDAARRRTMIGIAVAGVALLVAIVAIVAVVNNNGSSGAAATATLQPTAAGTPPVAISTVPPPPPASSIPSAPLVASLPAAAEVAASKAACAPFLAAGQSKQGAKQWGAPPKQVIDPSKHYQVTMYTEKGTITADILPKIAPITANSFIFLSCNGFYDGLIFHRTIPGFMIQGGDPKGDGTGGPGYQFKDEPVARGYAAGDLAMANAGANTSGSQFFVIQGPQGVALPPSYNLFGHVTRGENVVDAIVNGPAHSNGGGETSAPDKPVHIRTITVQVS